MAIHALWEDRYGLSIRKGPIDLSKLSATVDADANVDVASHNDDGTPTASQKADTTTQIGGDQHFKARDSTTTSQGQVIGQRTASGTGIIFGMPVVGNPDFSTGQETIEVQKTDGFATQRVGGLNEASDLFRSGQNPSASFDFVATGKSLIHAGALFFQAGLKETTGSHQKKYAKFPSNTDGSDPLYYGCFLRKISAADANSRIISDAVGTSFSLRASQSEPLTCGLGMSGRVLGTDFDVSTDNGGLTEATAFGLDGKKNYLLQDSTVTFEKKQHVVIFASGSGTFIAGDTITGATSGATGLFSSLTGTTAGALVMTDVTGDFAAAEVINGTGGASGTVTSYHHQSLRTVTYSVTAGVMAAAEVITGSTSAVTATIISYTAGSITILGWTGDFTIGETITGGTSSATGVVLTEKSMGIILAVESFDVNCSAEVTPNRFNTFFPLNLVLGNYTVDGSFSTAALGKGTNILNGNDFQLMMADAGAGAGSDQSASITPYQATFNWVTSMTGDAGSEIVISDPAAAQDFQVKVNVVITDVSWGGDTEATMTIAWRGMNQFTAGTDTIVTNGDAFNMTYFDDQTISWGYNRTVNLTTVSGTFVVGETVTGGTSAFTAVIVSVGTSSITVDTSTGIFTDTEELTGGTSAVTANVAY